MNKRVVKFKIKAFNDETKNMSFVEIGKYISFLIILAESNKISKEEINTIYRDYLPPYINKNLLRIDDAWYTVKNIKSIDLK